ncbi:MAG: FeoB-associated Cys-rich membrane protein [Oceanospirillaceae bacterium]|nr:FeoB-associated Cys-rich membrane protein [Oceanospirillaceae bacterium]
MQDLGLLDWLVLLAVIGVILIWFSRFVRRSLKAGCNQSAGCAGCKGCDQSEPPRESSSSST